MDNLTIRLETEKDYRAVEELTREAFWNVYKPGADEHYFVHMMRNHPDFIPELAFVLEKDGEIIGNIMYTKAWLEAENGEKKEIDCDMVLLSAGRKPSTADIGVETLQLEMDRAAIKTDRHLCTNVSGVYAIGDCNGKLMLAHTAYREGEVAINNMLGKKDRVDYRAIPAVIYTNPEVGTVGETKESAEKAGMKVTEHTISLRYSGRYIAENEGGDGIVKIIVGEHREIVGVHMIGSYASEIIYGAAAMVAKKERVEDVRKLVFPHPTVCEVIREEMFSI